MESAESNFGGGRERSRFLSGFLRELPPLRISLPALFLVTALICGLTALALTFSAEKGLVEREFRNHAGFLATFVLAQIERDLRAGDIHSLRRSVHQLNFDRNLHYAVLLGEDNGVLETTELGRATILGQEQLAVVEEARRSASGFAQRVVDGHLLLTANESGQQWNLEAGGAPDSEGARLLLLEHDLRRVRGENRSALLTVVGISTFPILLSAVLFSLIVRTIVLGRMNGLVEQFGRILRKAGPTGEPLPGRDEFSWLSRRIETMAEEMEKTTGALTASEERLSLALRGSNDGLWDWNLRTDEVYFSPRWKSMMGYEDSELDNTLDTWKDLLHPAERARVVKQVEEFLDRRESRKPFQIEFRFREKRGGYRDILSRAFLIKEEEGTPVRLVGTHVDITELKQARHELRLARFAIENAPEEVFWIGANGKILYANRTALERLGYSLEEICSLHFSDIDSRNRRDDWPLYFSLFRKGGALSLEAEHRTADGSVYPVDLRISYGVFEGREYLCAFSRDATERKRAEKRIHELNENLEAKVEQRTLELNEANRALESFAYTVSHDLRAPLRSVNGFAEALETDYAEELPEEARGYLDRIRKAAQTMSGMINSLLELSRISRDTLDHREIDLAEIAGEIVAEFRTIQPDRSVAVSIEPEMIVSGDEGLLRALLHNLIGNSWKFTKGVENAEISLYSEEKEGGRVFVVEDNGVGFDVENTDSLFQPFTRYHRQSEFEGEGIGLATVRRIVDRHGGWVRIESASGKGTKVEFAIGTREN